MSWVFVIWELVGIFKCFMWPCLFSLSWLFFLLLFWLYINCAVSALNFEKLWFYMKYIFSVLTGIYGYFEFWSILPLQLCTYLQYSLEACFVFMLDGWLCISWKVLLFLCFEACFIRHTVSSFLWCDASCIIHLVSCTSLCWCLALNFLVYVPHTGRCV